ncbi:hypothetical protein E2C01_027565 [Portunus trituberculatus]|uniref:Uncharacterized protein n=1 Tax=Portunus trituberculatus TaxID=210409 RepID=A0A5B7EP17_PORTR|nr:hypothetical protein [Portunus trituberculatus]
MVCTSQHPTQPSLLPSSLTHCSTLATSSSSTVSCLSPVPLHLPCPLTLSSAITNDRENLRPQ